MKKKHFEKHAEITTVDLLCGGNIPCMLEQIVLAADRSCNGICW